MRKFITRINGFVNQELMNLQDEISISASNQGWLDMALYVYDNRNEKKENLQARYDGIIAGLSRGDVLCVQLPTGNGRAWEEGFINTAKAYGANIIILWHSITDEYCPFLFSDVDETIKLSNTQSSIIVKSISDLNVLKEKNIRRTLPIFVLKQHAQESKMGADYYLAKVLNEAAEVACGDIKEIRDNFFSNNTRPYEETEQFTFFTIKPSYGDKYAISYNYNGDCDGIMIYANDQCIWETADLNCHYALINEAPLSENLSLCSFVHTFYGKKIISKIDIVETKMDNYNQNNIDISIIIPTYNAAKFISQTLDSVLAQSKENIEIIIVDDESHDNTCEIVQWYCNKYSQVRLITKKNGGQAQARNTGIDAARGKYIGFMDHDDILPVNALKILFDSIIKTDSDIAFGPFVTMTKNGEQLCEKYEVPDYTLFAPSDILQMQTYRMIWNRIYKSELCKNHPFGPRKFEDHAWIPVVLSYANRISYINTVVYEYDQTYDTQSKGIWSLPVEEIEDAYKEATFYALKNCNSTYLVDVKRHELRFWKSLNHIFPNCARIMDEINNYTA